MMSRRNLLALVASHSTGVLLASGSMQTAPPYETYTADVGPIICEVVREAMQTTEPEWHRKLTRGYEWWPHWYRQRITASPKSEDLGVALSRITIETVVLEEVSPDETTYARLAELNLNATTSALSLIPETGQVVSFSGVMGHEQNIEVAASLAATTTAMQATEVEVMADRIKTALGGQFKTSEAPGGSIRTVPDDMTNFAKHVVIPAGSGTSVFIGDECPRADREVGHWSLLTNASRDGLSAEFEWEPGSEPTITRIARGEKNPRTETVLLRMSADEQHPVFGTGMRVILALPVDVPADLGPKIANQMNLAERLATRLGHQYGAWTYLPPSKLPDIDPLNRLPAWPEKKERTGTLFHVTFLPNATHFPGVTSVLFQAGALRSRWAKTWIDENTELRLDSKPPDGER